MPAAIPDIQSGRRLALNYREAAESLGISRPTLIKLVEAGAITPARAGRRQLFSLSQLQRFLDDGGERSI